MVTPVEFLRARLEDTQRRGETLEAFAAALHFPNGEIADTIAETGEQMLADVAAKLRIVDEYERAIERRSAHPDDLAAAGALLALHGAVNLLAASHAQHPDYDPSWRPAEVGV